MITDWNALPGGYDFSHWNGPIDWNQVADQKPAFVILKATDGLSVDPLFDRNRRGAEDRKLGWLWYPYLEPVDNDKAIEHALKVIADPNIPPGLDWEKPGVKSAVMERWMQLCEAEARAGLGYYGLSAPDKVTPFIARWLRWYAQYPGSPNAAPRLPMWNGKQPADWSRQWLIWQWSEKGRVPGVKTAVDMDRLACSAAEFRTWYDTGVLPAQPSPIDGPVPPAPGRALRLNMTGDDVLGLQMQLAAKGFRVMPDGYYGPSTRRAVVSFQEARRLTADGIAGAATLRALAA